VRTAWLYSLLRKHWGLHPQTPVEFFKYKIRKLILFLKNPKGGDTLLIRECKNE